MRTIYTTFLLFGSAYVIAQPVEKSTIMCLDTTMDFAMGKSRSKIWTACEPSTTTLVARSQRQLSAPFDINFSCHHVDQSVCIKAKKAFTKVGKMISDVMLFKEPIHVNATLLSFCKSGDECGEHIMTLGGSAPARSVPLLNEDGVMRLHPQALVKQFELTDRPAFAPYDILSVFNADAPFWYEDDDQPIGPNQADFSFVILVSQMHS